MHLRSGDFRKVNFNKKEKMLKQTRLVFKIVKDPLRHWISTNTKITNTKNTIRQKHEESLTQMHVLDKNCDSALVSNDQNNHSKECLKTRSMFKESEILSGTYKFYTKKSSRPKRIITPKKNEPLLGISWKEESQLTKALYASLQEIKPVKESIIENFSLTKIIPNNNQHLFSKTMKSNENINYSNYNDNYRSKVKAQRKFAEGFHAISSSIIPKIVCQTPPPPNIIFPDEIPSTDDFIQFLILRGTNSVPPELEHFNYPNCMYPIGTQASNKIDVKLKSIKSNYLNSLNGQDKEYNTNSKSISSKSSFKQMNRNKFKKQFRSGSKSSISKVNLYGISSNESFRRRQRLQLKNFNKCQRLKENKRLHNKYASTFVPLMSTISSKFLYEMQNKLPQLKSLSRPNTRSLMAAKDRLRLMQAQMANN